jgi:multiple antibiotic resistance protein
MPGFDILLHKSFVAFLLGGFVSLVTIINPASKIPLFVSVTRHFLPAKRRHVASRACLYAFGILTVSLFAGGLILDGFGISPGALRIAGGLVVAVVGYRMLFVASNADQTMQAHHPNVAFFPLALPGISGPGAIAVVIGFSTEIAELKNPFQQALAYAGSVISIVICCVIVWLVLRSATRIARWLGEDGTEALTRLMGFLLICIGVQFIGSGIRTFVAGS